MSFDVTPESVINIHEDIVREYADSEATAPGVRDESGVETAVHLAGYPSTVSETFSTASSLLINLASNHPFADANKRTALCVAAALIAIDGNDLQATREFGMVLKVLGIDRQLIHPRGLANFLEARSKYSPDAPNDLRAAAEWHREEYRDVYDWLETN